TWYYRQYDSKTRSRRYLGKYINCKFLNLSHVNGLSNYLLKSGAQMKNKSTFQQALLRYMKRNKRKTEKQAILVAFLLMIVLIVSGLTSNNFIKKTEPMPVTAEGDAITLGFTGDMMLGRFVEKTVDRYDPSVIFLGTGIDLTSLDYLSGNFEHPIINDAIELENKEREKIYLAANENVLDIIKSAGFTNINLANNHMYDYGEDGILYTI